MNLQRTFWRGATSGRLLLFSETHTNKQVQRGAFTEKGTPDKIDQILKKAVGCLVTVEEHKRLGKFDQEYDGWKRYRKAGISVIDTLTGKPKLKRGKR